MTEAELEKECVKLVEAAGGEALKLRIDGQNGFPDRTVLMPYGRWFMVEFKRPGGVLSAKQRHWCQRLIDLGYDVYVVDNINIFKKILESK